jgi:hypothetical protein
MNPIMENPAEPDDPRWDELLASADPMLEGGAEFDAAVGRLRSQMAQITQPAHHPANEVVTTASGKGAAQGWITSVVFWTAAAVVLLAFGATLAQVWKSWAPASSIHWVESKEGERSSETDVASPKDSTQPPTGTPDRAVTAADAQRKPKAPAQKRGPEKIRSVNELLKLTPSQLARVQRRLDQVALDAELLQWLGHWHEASVEQRATLEEQWVTHRGFWSGWTMRGLRHWRDPSALQAGIEILSLELGSSGPEQLGFCMQRIETASLAVPFLLPRANETQLASWLAEAPDSTTALAVLHELAGRSGQVATEALALLAADQVCHSLLRQATLKWHPAHAQRALTQLNSSNSQQQFLAAMILSVIDDERLDQELLSKARSGVQALPALSAYVFRHQNQLAEKLEPLQQSPSAMAAIPSAQQRSQKWQRQQRLDSPGPTSLRKVCQLCVTAS